MKNKNNIMKIKRGVLNFLSNKDFIFYNFYKKYYIHDYIFDKIYIAFELNIDRIFLFKIGEISIYIERDKWISPIEKCLEYFSYVEDYKKCLKCRDFLLKIKGEE